VILTSIQLRELLDYSAETGLLRWRVIPRAGMHRCGMVAGTKNRRGYLAITVRGRAYLAHRLIWLYVYGEWPSGQIDHINGDRADNRVSNLRDVHRDVNIQNQRRAQAHNRCGLLGVSTRPDGRFWARINLNGKQFSLGCFADASDAHQAYLAAKRKLHVGCTL
jgi:HNH endonuclease